MEGSSNTPRLIRVFQAKEIQQILRIPKHRYEYIASKIGIAPDIEEVEGQGKAHLYSFRNLIQFAIAHTANDLGLTPKKIRIILKCIDDIEQSDKKTGIYNGNAQGARLEAYHVNAILANVIALTDNDYVIKWYWPQGTDEQIKYMLISHTKPGGLTVPPNKTHIENLLAASTGFIGLRLGMIKLRTLALAIEYKRYEEDPEFRKGFDEAREMNIQKIEDWLSRKKTE